MMACALATSLPLRAQEGVPADIQEHPACIHCGMDRLKWQHTRHLVEYQDGHVEPTCSIRCAALSLDMNWGRTPKRIAGADQGTDAAIAPLVDAEKLTYVLRADQRGTMAPRSKYAYRSPLRARKAAGESGKLMKLPEALVAAFEDVVAGVEQKLTRSRERSRRTRR